MSTPRSLFQGNVDSYAIGYCHLVSAISVSLEGALLPILQIVDYSVCALELGSLLCAAIKLRNHTQSL